MSRNVPRPLIGLPADIKPIEGRPFHAVGDKYLRAIMDATNGVPLIIPAFGELLDLPDLVQRLDGLLLTGSPSNVHPERYGLAATPEAEPYDPERDATTLPLIPLALDQALPILAICRGMQELNVALGGTLHARVHELPERLDHRRPQHDDPDVQYGPKHEIEAKAGSAFRHIAGSDQVTVNSLHWQALDRVAPRLMVEAEAPDGTVEAVRVVDAPGFALGVQWHPEYKVMENDVSVKLFKAFGEAAQKRANLRAAGELGPDSRGLAAAGA